MKEKHIEILTVFHFNHSTLTSLIMTCLYQLSKHGSTSWWRVFSTQKNTQ